MSWDWDKLQQQKRGKQSQGPGGGVPPEIDEFVRKVKDFKFTGGGLLILVILLVLYLGSSMFFKVELDEVGVIQRFGKYDRTVQPGLNFKLPNGVEKVTKVKVKYVDKQDFGFRTTASSSRFSAENEDFSESLMLTGDLAVALVPWIIRFRVKDPYNYLFKVEDVEGLLRDMSEATMRLVVGDRSIQEVITKRKEIADDAKQILQVEMNNAEAGIDIVAVEMKKTNVPVAVQPSFNEVNQAMQEREKMIYQAKEDYNKAIPAAKGKAERTIREAEGYALERINNAEGEADRFKSLYNEYTKAKDITKRRLYLETVKDIFPKLGQKYIIESGQTNVLPLLNLGKEDGVIK